MMKSIIVSAIALLATTASASACLQTWSERPAGMNFAHHYMRNDCGVTVRLSWDDGSVTFIEPGVKTRYYGGFSWSTYE